MDQSQTYTDEELISMIQAEGSACNTALIYLYKQHRAVLTNFLASKGAKKEEVEDVFQEGIISMVVNIQEGRFKGKSSIKTYLYAIAKQILFKKQQKKQPVLGLPMAFKVDDQEVQGDHLLLSREQQLKIGGDPRAIKSKMQEGFKDVGHALLHEGDRDGVGV